MADNYDPHFNAATQNKSPQMSDYSHKVIDHSQDYDIADDGQGALSGRELNPAPSDQYIKRDDIENKGKV